MFSATLFLYLGTRKWWGVSVTPRPSFTPRKDPVPIVQEAGWASGPVWIGTENLPPTGIRSPDRPARSQSLYRLSYRAHKTPWATTNFSVGINIKFFVSRLARWYATRFGIQPAMQRNFPVLYPGGCSCPTQQHINILTKHTRRRHVSAKLI
jgi:hypothetical protein